MVGWRSRVLFGRRRQTAEWRRRQIARRMVGLPPQYADLASGMALLALLCGVLVAVVISRVIGAGPFTPIVSLAVLFVLLLTAMVPLRERYRHLVAGALVLALLVGALAVSLTRHDSLVPLSAFAGSSRALPLDAR